MEARKMKGLLAVYSHGMFHLSICTNITDRVEIVRRVNEDTPAGTMESGLKWEISEEPTFKGGQPNPTICDEGREDFMHYLMVC